MDPLSITTACFGLISTIGKASLVVTQFVRDVRGARRDLDAVSRELLSVRNVLELLADDVKDSNTGTFPQTLKKQITGIVTNCTGVVVEIEQTLEKHEGSRVSKAAQWVAFGRGDVAKLQSSLEAHKSALELALDMVTLTLAKDIKADTKALLDDTSAIKQDTAQILAEIARLQEQLPRGADRGNTSKYMLEKYLDGLTSYAETVCDTFTDDIDRYKRDDAGSIHQEKSSNQLPAVRFPDQFGIHDPVEISLIRQARSLEKVTGGGMGESQSSGTEDFYTSRFPVQTYKQSFTVDDQKNPRLAVIRKPMTEDEMYLGGNLLDTNLRHSAIESFDQVNNSRGLSYSRSDSSALHPGPAKEQSLPEPSENSERKKQAPNRSPLESTEVTLDSLNKKERKAPAEEAENLTRENRPRAKPRREPQRSFIDKFGTMTSFQPSQEIQTRGKTRPLLKDEVTFNDQGDKGPIYPFPSFRATLEAVTSSRIENVTENPPESAAPWPNKALFEGAPAQKNADPDYNIISYKPKISLRVVLTASGLFFPGITIDDSRLYIQIRIINILDLMAINYEEEKYRYGYIMKCSLGTELMFKIIIGMPRPWPQIASHWITRVGFAKVRGSGLLYGSLVDDILEQLKTKAY